LRALRDASAVLTSLLKLKEVEMLDKKRNQYHPGDTRKMI
jgi:hypothetical protein